MAFADYSASMQMRDIVTKIVKEILDRERPRARYGITTAIDAATRRASVVLNGDTEPVSIPTGVLLPAAVGQVVRVEGSGVDKYISGIITGPLSVDTINILSSKDISATTTDNAFQIGPTSGQNLVMDINEIMARNDSSPSTLNLNTDGGEITFQNNTSRSVHISDTNVWGVGGTTSTFRHGSPGSDLYIAIGEDDAGGRLWSMAAYNRTYSNAANCYITSSGTFGRSTSARKYKVDIEDAPEGWGEKFLELQPRTWFDRSTAEAYADLLTKEDKGEEVVWRDQDIPALCRIPGFIAEEVQEAGLDEFVIKDDDGEVEGLAYDRLMAAAHGVIKENRERIEELEGINSELESKVADMESQLASILSRLDGIGA